MLYECPKCHHRFDGKRKKCPNCGTPFYYGYGHEQLANKVAIYDELIEKERRNITNIFLPGIKVVQSLKFIVSALMLTLSILLMLLPFIYLVDYSANINTITGLSLFIKGHNGGASLVNDDIDLYCLILFIFSIVLFIQGLYLFIFNACSFRKKSLEKIIFNNYQSKLANPIIRFLDRTSQASYNALFCLIYLLIVPFRYNNLALIIFLLLAAIFIIDLFINIYLASIQKEMRKDKLNRPIQAYSKK